MTHMLTIYEPAPGSEAVVSGQNGVGYLCEASGKVDVSPLAGVCVLCEHIPNSGAAPTKTPGQVKAEGKPVDTLNSDGSWTATSVPGAHYKQAAGDPDVFNVLHVVAFRSGYPPLPPAAEPGEFKGIAGSCTYMMAGRTQATGAVSKLVDGTGAATGIGSKVVDLIDTWWDRSVNHAFRYEPVDRDGDWLLYRGLPVDVPFDVTLGLDGAPLRARSISVAAESIAIRRKLAPPFAHVAVPQGLGIAAVDAGAVRWRFPGYFAFGTMIHQAPSGLSATSTQPIHSTCRDYPTHMFVSPITPLRVAVNSPLAEDFLNEGHIDLWVRVNVA